MSLADCFSGLGGSVGLVDFSFFFMYVSKFIITILYNKRMLQPKTFPIRKTHIYCPPPPAHNKIIQYLFFIHPSQQKNFSPPFPPLFPFSQPPPIVEQYTLMWLIIIFWCTLMKNNTSQPSTPTGIFSSRLRLQSFNSPFISPIPIAQSPFGRQPHFLDSNPNNHPEFENFKLQEDGVEQNFNNKIDLREEEEESMELSDICENTDENIVLDESNMLDYVLRYVNRDNKRLDRAKEKLEEYGSEFNKKLFDYLYGKFKKLKKTKEQMVKYCIRKSFKYIMTKMRAANKAAYINMENNEVVAQYFEMNNQGDQSISMPFKKNSEEKTMNFNFLKKIFKCRQFNYDYQQFLKQFNQEYHSDNNKKIKSMNEAIKKAVKTKCFKGLDDYKRVPWTYEILQRIHSFAKSLMEHSPFRRQNRLEKKTETKSTGDKSKQKSCYDDFNNLLNDEFETVKLGTRKSVIILTPPLLPKAEQPPIQPQHFID